MQRIESARHRADLLEQAAAYGSEDHHRDFVQMARHWRACAEHLQLLYETEERSRAPRPARRP